jgi:hypothetical protein
VTRRDETLRRAYEFFRETAGQCVSVAQISRATGWSPSSVRTYIPKKWLGIVLDVQVGWGSGVYEVRRKLGSLDEFIKLHTQVAERFTPTERTVIRKLRQLALADQMKVLAFIRGLA